MRASQLLLPILTAAALACSPSDGSDSADRVLVETERQWTADTWVVDTLMGGVEDTVLAQPGGLAGDERGLFWFDLYQGAVLHADLDGTVRWRYGRRGGGPGEFRTPRGLDLSDDGSVQILDPDNARLSVISGTGQLLREFALGVLDGRPDRLASLSGSEYLLTVYGSGAPLVRMDGERVRESIQLPSRDLGDSHPLARQLVVAARGDRWAAGLAFGSLFFIDAPGRELTTHQFVEIVEPPEVSQNRRSTNDGTRTTTRLERPTFAAVDMVATPDELWVLFGGEGENRHRTIDRYGWDGAYRGSLALPLPVSDIAYADGRLYAFARQLYPVLIRLTPAPGDTAAAAR